MIILVTVIGAIWFAALTLVVLALLRQVAAIELALQQRGDGFRVDADGPDIGTSASEALVLIGTAGLATDDVATLLVIFSPTCGPCREIIESMDPSAIEAGVVTAAFVVGEGVAADEVALFAAPKFSVVVSGREAQGAAGTLNVHSSPYALVLVDGRVEQKRYVRRVDDLYDLARRSDSRARFVVPTRQVEVGGV